jgi:glycosyltransferase involved in cell wall biosynthesis
MAKLAWISDAGVSTGFGRVTEEIGSRLVQRGHEIHALAIGYQAERPYAGPLKLYRAEAGPARNYNGLDRTASFIEEVDPDVIVTLEDIPMLNFRLNQNPWDRGRKLLGRSLSGTPILSYLPVDGYALPPSWAQTVRQVNPVAMSQFGRAQLGVDMPVVYHGVGDAFVPATPEQKVAARKKFGLPADAFVVGRVDTNSGRKDWGAFWDVVERVIAAAGGGRQVVALCHTKASDPGHGMDLAELAAKGRGTYYITNGTSYEEADLVSLYQAMDVFLTTSRGEGFGMTYVEAEACGIPVVATDCSAISEVAGPGAYLIPPTRAFWCNPYGVQMRLADTEAMASVILDGIREPELLVNLGARGREHVVSTFSWDRAAASFHDLISALAG